MISEFAQFYVVNEKELDVIKKLDSYNEGGCCSQGGCFVCQLGGCEFKYESSIGITKENKKLLDFVCGSPYFTLSGIIEMTKNQDDYVDGSDIGFEKLGRLIEDDNVENIDTLCLEFYSDISSEELKNLDTDDHFYLFFKMIKYLTYVQYKRILKTMKGKMTRKLFEKITLVLDDANNLLIDIYRKFGLSRLLKVIERYYENNISYLTYFEVNLLDKKELTVLINELMDHPTINIKMTKKKIMIEID